MTNDKLTEANRLSAEIEGIESTLKCIQGGALHAIRAASLSDNAKREILAIAENDIRCRLDKLASQFAAL